MKLKISILLLSGLSVCSCRNEHKLILKSNTLLPAQVENTHLIENSQSLGKLADIIPAGQSYIYEITLTEKVVLKTDAQIVVEYPLLGGVTNIVIRSRGKGKTATSSDTLTLIKDTLPNPSSSDRSKAARLLRALADSIEAH